jgi:hypothetical protein
MTINENEIDDRLRKGILRKLGVRMMRMFNVRIREKKKTHVT